MSSAAFWVGKKAEAWDNGEHEGITILSEPQRAADGSWQVLVEMQSRPGWLTGLDVRYIKLDPPTTAQSGRAPGAEQ